jgi:DNA-binding CsgD family transcriptional regulator
MTTAKHDEILDRRDDVWERRVKGDTVREIAAALSISVGTVQSDLDAVRAELDENNKTRAEIERAVGASRLDAAAKRLLQILDADVPIGEATTEQLIDMASAIPAAINALARIEERRAKLLGLDAASKTELTGANGGPVQVEDAKRALLVKLSGLAAGGSTE